MQKSAKSAMLTSSMTVELLLVERSIVQSTNTQDCRGVIPEIPSHVWEYPKYRVIPETSGLPEISGNTRYFGLPATR